MERTLRIPPGLRSPPARSTSTIGSWDGTAISSASTAYVDTADPPTPLYGANALRFSNRSDVYEFDWGAGPAFSASSCPTPGLMSGYLRRTHTEHFAHNLTNGADYKTFDAHMPGLPASTTVFGAGGVKASEASLAYDETGLTSRSGIAQHVNPSLGHKRGNLTSITTQFDEDDENAAVVRRAYDVLGNIVSQTDAKNQITNYEYDDN